MISKLVQMKGERNLFRSHSSKSLFYFLCAACIAIVLAGSMGPQLAHAQNQNNLELTVRTGLGGYCKENRWIPVKITVENTGTGMDAQIQIINKADSGNNLVTAAEISLPTTSRKELFLSLYPQNYFRGLKARVVAKGKTLAETDLNITCISADNILIGLLTDSPSSYDLLSEVQTLAGTTKIAQLGLADLPDQVTGWAGLDALVISGVDTHALSSSQRQALELWVADGGRLFVVGGTKWQGAAAGMGELLPVMLTGTQKVSNLNALGQYFRVPSPIEEDVTLAVGTLRPQAYVLVEQDGFPLLVEKMVGFGHVYFFAADPGLQPLSRWEGMRAVYEFSLARKNFNLWNTTWNPNTANQALAILPALGIPSIFASCGWMLLYLLVIGPLNYLFLRRIKRMELAWISIPTLVIIFTLMTYVAGSISRGTRPIVNRMGISLSWDGVSQSQVRGLVGVYSPNRAKYNLEAKLPFVALPLTEFDTSLNTLQQGTSMLIPDITVEIGGMKTLAVDGAQPALALSHDLSFDLSSGILLEGKITNTTSYTIEDASLHLPNTTEDLGDFAPGESKEIQTYIQYIPVKSNPLFNNSSYYPYNNYGSNDDVSYRRTLLSQALSNSRPSQTDWGIYLTGWVKTQPVPVELRDKQFDSLDTNLVIIQLNPSLIIPKDTITIPNSFMFRETSTSEYPTGDTNIYIPAEGYFLRFWPAIPIPFSSVRSLTLHQDMDTSSNTNLALSLWNFESSQWEEIEDISQNEINLPNPEQYVGPGGEIRVRLDGNNQDWVYINRLDFELTVNR